MSQLDAAFAYVRPLLPEGPFVGLVLGSGLGGFAESMQDAVRVPYTLIPGFPPPAVEGHAGVLVAGTMNGVGCVLLQGRAHFYEGHDADTVALPVRLLVRLGLRALIVTNAAGAVNPYLQPASLMLIEDHINLLWRNPLAGPVQPGETRFPDMSAPYDAKLRATAVRVATELGLALNPGVYCAVSGPSYETAAEVRMFQRLGADAVGMSTVPEVLVARAAGVPVLGISVIANFATGFRHTPLSHEEVVLAGQAVQGDLTQLLNGIVRTFATAEP
jgi:purine-nucleoside phosphorylase